jgi:hypothetical protein
VGVVKNLPQTLIAQKHKHLGNLNEKASAEQPVNQPEKKRRSKSQKKRMVQQLLPTPVLLEAKRQEVISAATLMARALHAGPWPSPYRSFDPAIAEQQQSDYQAHSTHMSMVGASIEKFANDIIIPAMMEDLAHTTPAAHETNDNLRVFLGTLVMLREVLIQNAGSIFGGSAMLTGQEADFGSTLAETTIDNGNSETATVDVDAKTAALFSIQVLATMIILTGLADLGDASDVLRVSF